MGGGDLNLKKEWHPGTLKNQEQVWKAEQKAKQEQQKLEQLKKELDEERQLMELKMLQSQASLNNKDPKNNKVNSRLDRLDWMYNSTTSLSSSNNNNNLNNNNLEHETKNDLILSIDKEDVLLGKKSIYSVLDNNKENNKSLILSNGLNIENLYNHEKETQIKIRQDPLFNMKLKEKEMISRLISTNPSLMRKLTERISTDKTIRNDNTPKTNTKQKTKEYESKYKVHSNSSNDYYKSKHKNHKPNTDRNSLDEEEKRQKRLRQMMEDAEQMDKKREARITKNNQNIQEEKMRDYYSKKREVVEDSGYIGQAKFIKMSNRRILEEKDLRNRIRYNNHKAQRKHYSAEEGH